MWAPNVVVQVPPVDFHFPGGVNDYFSQRFQIGSPILTFFLSRLIQLFHFHSPLTTEDCILY